MCRPKKFWKRLRREALLPLSGHPSQLMWFRAPSLERGQTTYMSGRLLQESLCTSVNGKTLLKKVQDLLSLMNKRDSVPDKSVKTLLRSMKMETFQTPRRRFNRSFPHYQSWTVNFKKITELTAANLTALFSALSQLNWRTARHVQFTLWYGKMEKFCLKLRITG